MQLAIEHKTETITFQLEYRKRRTLEIRILPPDQVMVIAPKGMSQEKIIKIVQEKAAWISKKLNEYNGLKDKLAPKEYKDGETFLYLGNTYPLWIQDTEYKMPKVKFQEDSIYIYSANREEDILKKAMERWYRKRALEVVEERIDHYQQYFKVKPSGIVVKEQKKRWGSCTSAKKLLFNWRLIMAPVPVLDYVIVHEMCHMIHMNHSKNFWNQVEAILPDYKERRKWLKLNGILMEL